jgi:hypothetical protein
LLPRESWIPGRASLGRDDSGDIIPAKARSSTVYGKRFAKNRATIDLKMRFSYRRGTAGGARGIRD